MKKVYFDLHTHTIASGHAYSTLQENARAAKDAGLTAYGFSDHNEGLPGAPDNIYFSNLKIIPRKINECIILRGSEVNIMDYEGNYNLKTQWAEKLDYIIASLHNYAYTPGTVEQNTRATLGAIANPFVRIIGHPDDERFKIDYEAVVKEAAKQDVLIELNNSSLLPKTSRVNCLQNDREILTLCEQYGTRILISSDAHISYAIGHYEAALALLDEMHFPDELVANFAPERILWAVSPMYRDEIAALL